MTRYNVLLVVASVFAFIFGLCLWMTAAGFVEPYPDAAGFAVFLIVGYTVTFIIVWELLHDREILI